jgi:anti-anti-sigma factor
MTANSWVTSGDSLVVVAEPLTGAMLPDWQAMLTRVLDARPARLIIDLSGTPNIDADGITALLHIHRRLVSGGGQLIVRAPNARIRRLFQLARVNGVLTLEMEARP